MNTRFKTKASWLLCGLVGLFLVTSVEAWSQQGTRPITLQELTNWRFAPRSAGRSFRSMSDGRYYTTLNRERTSIMQYEFSSGKAVATLFDLKDVESRKISQKGEFALPRTIDDYEIAPDGHHILLKTETEAIYRRSSRSTVFHYDVRRQQIEPLSTGKLMIPTFSPDGRMVAFVRDNNIFIRKFDYDSEVQVTTDGKRNEIINGATDWVYEEELYCTKLLSWSEDGRHLAFVRFDEREVPAYSMPMYGDGLYPGEYTYKYPKAGEKNSDVSLHVYNVDQKVVRQVSLPIDTESYIPRIEFTPIKNQLAVCTLNRHQNDFVLYLVDPQTLVAKPALRDADEAYIKIEWINSLVIDAHGFTMVSEADGYAHLYRYSTTGEKVRQLTKGTWDIITLYGVDKVGNAYYQAADETPIRRRILKVSPKGGITVLAGEPGINQATFSEDFSHFLNIYSSSTTPPQYTIRSSREGKVLRELENNKDLSQELFSRRYSSKEFIQLEVASGRVLHGWIQKPINFDPNKRYPLLMVQYSGPDSQEVLDQFDMDWTVALAEEGYVVACFDGRGTGARGREWRKSTYLQLGILESDDQIAAAKALGKLNYVDAGRIGIWGWSFGGYMTLLSLCRGDGTFKAGVAVAPVTDWRFYDSIYTERYLRTPQENPQGYRNGAPLAQAARLRGNLLIVHGSADDNVHLQNTMDFTEQLVQNNIPFDMAIYTDRDHSIYGGNTRYHLFTRIVNYLKTNL